MRRRSIDRYTPVNRGVEGGVTVDCTPCIVSVAAQMSLTDAARTFPSVQSKLERMDVEQAFALVEGLDALRKKEKTTEKLSVSEFLLKLGEEIAVEDIDAFLDACMERLQDLKGAWKAALAALEETEDVGDADSEETASKKRKAA